MHGIEHGNIRLHEWLALLKFLAHKKKSGQFFVLFLELNLKKKETSEFEKAMFQNIIIAINSCRFIGLDTRILMWILLQDIDKKVGVF